ncbi:MAG: hypothetical protein KDE08_04860 [Rhodobacteraceae bacterium]|nr:hypothetical protein [Paracoccaceae bacterium]
MSDDYTTLVPRDPHFRADDSALDAAAEWMRWSFDLDEVNSSSSEKPQFFDAGSNFESVSCPVCEIELSMDWWSERMDEDYDGEGFRLGFLETPCCQRKVTLNDLTYHFHQAFGVCAVQGLNLNVGALTDRQLAEAEHVFGAPLSVVYTHY